MMQPASIGKVPTKRKRERPNRPPSHSGRRAPGTKRPPWRALAISVMKLQFEQELQAAKAETKKYKRLYKAVKREAAACTNALPAIGELDAILEKIPMQDAPQSLEAWKLLKFPTGIWKPWQTYWDFIQSGSTDQDLTERESTAAQDILEYMKIEGAKKAILEMQPWRFLWDVVETNFKNETEEHRRKVAKETFWNMKNAGAEKAYLELPMLDQYYLKSCAIAKVAAYESWRQQFKPNTGMRRWDELDGDAKSAWLPKHPLQFLSGYPQYEDILRTLQPGVLHWDPEAWHAVVSFPY